jgi:N-acetylneuraminate synthase
MPQLRIGDRCVGDDEPVYFIADIAANHDGSLERAKKLIYLAKERGADAAKFQNFRAPKIVSKEGFEALNKQLSHQAKWKKSVYEVYEDASIPWEWTEILKGYCDEVGIQYLSTPYDFEAVDILNAFVPAFKIGSGDITWSQMLDKVAKKGKPVILATGASSISDVERAVRIIRDTNPNLILLQCNTDYTGSHDQFMYLNLNVLRTYEAMYPDLIVGLSDHSPGHSAVLGAVALGARVVEKHFTDDTTREGPDHSFSMDTAAWKEMVERTRELELALGDGGKKVEENEAETVVVQRRCLRAAKEILKATVISNELVDVLRPAPRAAIFPYDLEKVLGKRACVHFKKGDYLKWENLE